MNTTLSPEQELIAVELRKRFCSPQRSARGNARVHQPSRLSGWPGRCLRPHGVFDLRDLVQVLEDEKASTKKTFKDYKPGYLNIDIKYLPQMPDEKARRYLFVAIDRATRWVFMYIYADQSDGNSTDF
jgi:hypothetical protein